MAELYSLAKVLNASDTNCRPLSLMTRFEIPCSENSSVRMPTTVLLVMLMGSLLTKGNLEL